MERKYRGRFYSELQRRLENLEEPLLTERQERAVYDTIEHFQRWAFGKEESGEADERLLRPFKPEILFGSGYHCPKAGVTILVNSLRQYVEERRSPLQEEGRVLTDGDALDLYNASVNTQGRPPVVIKGFGQWSKELLERYLSKRGLREE